MRADFYLLSDGNREPKGILVCRLLEKAYHRNHRVFVYCENQQDAEWIDDLLWTYKEDSFVPHHIQGEGPEPPPPVQIGYGQQAPGFHDILVNLAVEIPAFFQQFKRVIEVIEANDNSKAIAREHYRFYKAHQLELHTHQISLTT